MKGIIYCNKLEKGLEQFERIVEDYKKIGIEILGRPKATTSSVSVTFANEDYWIVTTPKENARGRSCNIAYIDEMISDSIIQTIIKPTIKALPYQAYKYY